MILIQETCLNETTATSSVKRLARKWGGRVEKGLFLLVSLIMRVRCVYLVATSKVYLIDEKNVGATDLS